MAGKVQLVHCIYSRNIFQFLCVGEYWDSYANRAYKNPLEVQLVPNIFFLLMGKKVLVFFFLIVTLYGCFFYACGRVLINPRTVCCSILPISQKLTLIIISVVLTFISSETNLLENGWSELVWTTGILQLYTLTSVYFYQPDRTTCGNSLKLYSVKSKNLCMVIN
jgi:hypothetical protein